MAFVQKISIEQLRRGRSLSPTDTYLPPADGDLHPAIVAGKRALDESTGYTLIHPAKEVRDAPAAEIIDDRFLMSKSAPLPLRGPFSRRRIDGSFLWVEIEEGRMVVLDESQDQIMALFCQGVLPTRIEDDPDVFPLVGLLAKSGMLRGIRGHVDETLVNARRFFRIHLTERCNLSCVHCYADSSPYLKADGELPVQRWMELITEFAQLGGERVLFTGGEALAYSGCDKLLELSKRLGLHVTLFTNGILVPRFLEAICASVDEVQISIDGAGAASNDPIRGEGSFEKAAHAIDLLSARGTHVRISTVAMKDNWDDIKEHYLEFAEKWRSLPVSFKLNYGVMTHGRGGDLTGELDINETRPVVDAMMASLHPIDGTRIVRSTTGCGYGEQIVVAPNGEVHPCHLLDGAIGSLASDSIEHLLHTIKAVQLDYSVDTSIGCKTCDIRHLCGGTCRVENGKRTGNRRVTFCDADEKLRKLTALKRTFA